MEERKTLITDLPVDVFCLMDRYCEWTDTNHLTSTNRYLFYNVKQCMYLKLNRRHSLKYYEDEGFRELVLSRVDKPRKQLSLDLSYQENVFDVSHLGNVHTFDLRICRNVIVSLLIVFSEAFIVNIVYVDLDIKGEIVERIEIKNQVYESIKNQCMSIF